MKSGPVEPQYLLSTIGPKNPFALTLILLTVFHIILSLIVPPVEDELYYFDWARNLNISYFDHPPFIAYFIKIFTTVFGTSVLGFRMAAIFLSTFTIFLLSTIEKEKFVLNIFLFCPIFFLASILTTPDLPLMFFWTIYLLWNIKIENLLSAWSEDPVDRVYHKSPVPFSLWVVGGIILGFGFLSKYSFVIAVLTTFIYLATQYRLSAWFFGFAIHGLVGLLLFSPVLYFNYLHNFEPFKFQLHHAFGGGSSFRQLLEMLSNQILLMGLLPVILFIPILLKARTWFRQYKVCFYFFLIPSLFFFYQAFKGNLEPNWTIPAYLSFWPLAQKILNDSSFGRELKIFYFVCFIPSIVVTVFLFIHIIKPLSFIPVGQDRYSRAESTYALTKKMETPNKELWAGNYQWVSALRYVGFESYQLPGHGRPSHYSLYQKSPCEKNELYLLFNKNEPMPEIECFKNKKIIQEYPLMVRNNLIETYVIIHYIR
jgi:4-amino-4-deoxy-L-arabinose transferase-like glycosyltransferase